MKQRIAILSTVLAITLVFAAFFVGKASATTGCFSDATGHWAETFICWLKDNGISTGYVDGTYHPDSPITRAEMAVMLQKMDDLASAQAKTYTDASLSGPIQVIMDPSEWNAHTAHASLLTKTDYYTDVRFLSAAGGSRTVVASPTIPVALYGHSLKFTGFKICYNAIETPITSINAFVDTQSTGTSVVTVYSNYDNVIRTNAACVFYSVTPTVLTPNSIIDFAVVGNWTAGSTLVLGHITLVLEPTTTLAPAPLAPTLDSPESNLIPKPGDTVP